MTVAENQERQPIQASATREVAGQGRFACRPCYSIVGLSYVQDGCQFPA